MHAGQLAEASKIASVVYRQIPKEERSIKLFRTIVGKAKVLLAAGKDKEVVLELLLAELNPETKAIVPKQRIKRKKELRLFVNKEGTIGFGKFINSNYMLLVRLPHKAILNTNNGVKK